MCLARLINGGFDVWQRATSNTTNSGFRSVDRWAFNTYTGGAFTVSKETDSTFGNVLKWRRTTADTSNTNAGNCIQQSIENAKYLVKGKSVTVSFWLKNEKTVLRSGFVRFRINVSPYTLLAPAQYWESSGNEWEYHSLTFETSETVNSDHIELQIQMDNGSSMGAMYIAQCQFELGKVATPFEHRSYGEELALCQRYYQRIQASSDNYKHFGLHFCAVDTGGTSYGTAAIPLVTTMRSIPTLITTGTVSDYAVYAKNTNFPCTALSIDTGIDDGTISGNLYINAYTGSGNTAGAAGALRANNTASGFIALDAEL